MPPDAQKRLFGNIARHMGAVPREIQLRRICHFIRADPNYGKGVAHALGINLEEFMAANGNTADGPAPVPAGTAR